MSHMTETNWRALDHCDQPAKQNSNATIDQNAVQSAAAQQTSDEWIIIKDSENIDVTTTDRQTAVSLQLGIEAAITAVIQIAIADSTQARDIKNSFKQVAKTKQANRQKTIVEQSKDVEITTEDTDIAVNVQIMLQVLLAVVASLDIL
ncbi:spore coat protein [Barrientosiimonas marina]|uniref:Spore coat protein n=1 Tax=Lentibacillus kimchii TaxID=1542911 RepID=A0ABW2UW66_9BACI